MKLLPRQPIPFVGGTMISKLTCVSFCSSDTKLIFIFDVFSRLALESYLVLATAEPLCLDPSPTVQVLKNLLDDRKRTFKTHAVKR